ncbi:MAG TPA: cytochrome C oxidase subunit IV family protein [Bacteroidia bacterium]|nr:cytochrome C oxidase subunit IV family protein [Bacteroidia bacterium]
MSDQTHHNSDHPKGYYTGDIHNQFIEEHHVPNNVKIIWKTFWILLGITIFEVGIAFTSIPHHILILLFITLTIVKAYYIVAFFMHLKHEETPLKYSILLPFILILYLIVMVIAEGTYLNSIG